MQLNKNRNLTFWSLHLMGWMAYGFAQYAGALLYGKAIAYTKVILIALWQNVTRIEDLDAYRAGRPKEGAAPPSEAPSVGSWHFGAVPSANSSSA